MIESTEVERRIWHNRSKNLLARKKKGRKTSACEKVSSGDGRETPSISGVLLNTERDPPVIGLAEVAVGCVYLSGSICV